jgi:hypothetical protein
MRMVSYRQIIVVSNYKVLLLVKVKNLIKTRLTVIIQLANLTPDDKDIIQPDEN